MLTALRTWLIANIPGLSAGMVHVINAEQGTTGTHVVLTREGDDPNNHLGGRGGLNVAEVDIDVKSQTPDAAEALADAIEAVLEPAGTQVMGSKTLEAAILIDRRDWHEAAKDGRNVDQYVTTLEFQIQYR